MPRRSEAQDTSLERLERLLQSPDPLSRSSAAEALGRCGAAARPALPALRRAMQAGPAQFGVEVASAILCIAPRDRGAADHLLTALRHPDPAIRDLALCGLGSASGHRDRIIPALLASLSDPEPEHRSRMLGLLHSLAPRAADWCVEMAEAVARALAADPSVEVRHRAVGFFHALPRAGWMIGIRALRAALEDVDDNIRSAASAALVGLAHKEPAGVRELAHMLAEGSERIARLGASGLAELGRKAKAAMPELIKALASDDYWIWSYAAMALGEMGKAARRALPALEQCVREKTAKGLYADEPKEAIAKIRGGKG